MRVLSLLFLAITACASAPGAAGVATERTPLLGEDWFTHRAAELALDVEAAKRRDAAMSEAGPPDSYEDPRLMDQGAVLWSALCAKCHGEDGDPPENAELDPPPRAWGGMGAAMGFFFGGDKMRAGIYRRIADGGEVKEGKASAMPAWKESLSREQIWALVGRIESF